MNLNLGQTAWNRFLGDEMGMWLGLYKCLRNERRRYSTKRNRVQVKEINNVNGFTSNIKFAGIKLGINTAVDGRLYIRIFNNAPGAGQATVEFHTAPGGSTLVATANGNYNTTLTINPSNGSGILASGSFVHIGTVTSGENDDKHQVELFPDWALRAQATWDGTVNDDSESEKAFFSVLAQLEQLELQKIAIAKSGFEAWLANRGKNLMQSGQSKAVQARTTVDGGVVTTSYVGVLEDLRRNMVDEVTPGAQKIVQNVVATTGLVFASSNRGLGAAASPSLQQFAPIGTLIGVCSDDSTIAHQLFDLSITDADGNLIQGQNQLEVGRLFSDPDLGIQGLLVSPSYSYSAGGASDFATVGDWTFSGQSSSNTNDGVLYFKCVAGTVDPTKFAIEVYKSSSYDSGQLVAKTDEGAANAVVALKQRSVSGLTGTGKIGTAPTAGHTCTFNLNPFRPSDNAGGIADQFTMPITSTSKGEYAEGLSQLEDYQLNAGASGTETINDGYVRRGAYSAMDVLD